MDYELATLEEWRQTAPGSAPSVPVKQITFNKLLYNLKPSADPGGE